MQVGGVLRRGGGEHKTPTEGEQQKEQPVKGGGTAPARNQTDPLQPLLNEVPVKSLSPRVQLEYGDGGDRLPRQRA